MVHGVRIENGSAYYVSRYVKNSRYLQEKEFGKAKFFKYGDMEGAYGLFVVYIQLLRERLKVLDMTYGHTTSNVGLVYHAGRVMALEDFGKPYVLSVNADGDLETIGMNNYGGKLDHNFTPHPKKDPVTGEMFIVGLGHTAPYATYRVVNRDGQIRNAVPITVSGPTYLHDLAITENYAIIMDNPYVFSPERMVVKDKWVFSFDATKKSRFGILPRYATDEKDIKWFEFQDPFFVFHTANAWEEEDKVILYCCIMEPIYNSRTGDFDILPTAFRNFTNKVNRDGPPLSLTLPDLFKLTFNMSTGETTKERIPTFPDSKGVDNPRINEAYMARKCRFIYTNQFTENGMAISLIKYDVETGIRQRISPGANAFFSEHVFVPKQSPTSEDDGYLLNFVHYERINTTVLFVIDARTLGRICSIELQTRIPYGFHSIFVSKEELASQVRTLP
ncbi:oxygenase [Lithospermum erythrorhizon]|uniref:carotenoid 9,10-dioxygenase n=1 Tax=Lithospermum erythrorhizon TaxID=34254 RepID=A0AAV3NYE0_LITER